MNAKQYYIETISYTNNAGDKLCEKCDRFFMFNLMRFFCLLFHFKRVDAIWDMQCVVSTQLQLYATQIKLQIV